MFITIHYGDTDSLLLNSNCQCKILLERIKKACSIGADEIIDIADMQAVVQKLSDVANNTYASQVVQFRGNYILTKIIRRFDESGQFCKEYIPMLNGLDTVNPEFITRLSNRKVNPDAYSKDMKENLPSRLGTTKRGAKNEQRGSGKPKASSASLSAGSNTPQKKTSQRNNGGY